MMSEPGLRELSYRLKEEKWDGSSYRSSSDLRVRLYPINSVTQTRKLTLCNCDDGREVYSSIITQRRFMSQSYRDLIDDLRREHNIPEHVTIYWGTLAF